MARILQANGATVVREYYFNDHGDRSTASPSRSWPPCPRRADAVDGYKGAYIDEIARRVIVEANAEGIDILNLPRVDGGHRREGRAAGRRRFRAA